MYIKTTLGVTLALTFSVIFTTNLAYADCAGFSIEDFDPSDYEAIFTGKPIAEVRHKDKIAQLIEVKDVYTGHAYGSFPHSMEWVSFVAPELSDDCYPTTSALHTTELYLVRAEQLFSIDYVNQAHVTEKFVIDGTEYKAVLKTIEKHKKKGKLSDKKIQEISAKEQSEKIEKKMQVLIDELSLLLSEYRYWTAR